MNFRQRPRDPWFFLEQPHDIFVIRIIYYIIFVHCRILLILGDFLCRTVFAAKTNLPLPWSAAHLRWFGIPSVEKTSWPWNHLNAKHAPRMLAGCRKERFVLYGFFSKSGENPPKWMVYNLENLIKMDDLRGTPIFGNTHISLVDLGGGMQTKNTKLLPGLQSDLFFLK